MSHNVCVLVLEDNPTKMAVFEKRIKEILGPNDLFFGVASGQAAIDLLERRQELDDRPCIFILDLTMPGEVKGFDVLRWIRASASYSGCSVVILAPADSDVDRKTAEDLGADRYYVKPRDAWGVAPLVKAILAEFRHSKPHNPLLDSMGLRIERSKPRGK